MTRDLFEDLNIVMFYGEITILVVLSFYFLTYVKKKKGLKQIHGNFAVALSVFFLTFAFYKSFFLIWNNYSLEEIYRILGRIFIVSGALLALFIINQIFFKQIMPSDLFRRILVALLFTSTIVFVSIYFIFTNLESLILLVVAFFVYASIIIYYSLKWFNTIGSFVKRNMILFLTGSILFLGGAALGRIVQYLTEYILPLSIAANTVELFGLTLMTFGVYRLPMLIEFDWKTKMIHLYIMHKDGLLIFEREFKKIDVVESTIVGGGITGIITAIKAMTKSKKKMSIIEQGDRNILLEYGEHVTLALMIEEPLEIFTYKLKELLNNFEVFFKDFLSEWDGGDVRMFLPAGVLIDRILS